MTEERNQALIDEIVIQALRDDVRQWQQRAEAAEAKLAELEKQEPVAWHVYQWRESPKGWDWYLTRAFASEPNNSDGWRSVALFTRPAPAADLVPECVKRDALRYRFLRERDYFGADDEPGLASWDELCDLNCNEFDAAVDARMNHPDSLYSATLRNIEEAK